MTNQESLQYHKERIERLCEMIASLEYAIVIANAHLKKVVSGVQLAIDELKRELSDERFMYEEIKIHIEKENGI